MTLSSISFNQNRAEVAVYRLLQHHQTPRKGKNRQTIFKIVYSTLKFITIATKYNQLTTKRFIKYFEIYCNRVTQNALLNDIYSTIVEKDGLSNKSLLKIAGDVELNPGPGGRVLISLNCRGLKKDTKFKQLINRLHKSHSGSGTLIVALQETHLEHNTLKYTWKGNHVFTEGTGNKGGIITLLSENIKVVEECNIGNEAHICALRIMENNELLTVIMANIHAPCAHGHEKITFFNDVKNNIDKLSNLYDTSQVVLLGDFNTAFGTKDRINTVFTRSEILISEKITDILRPLALNDCWDKDASSMTWKHGAKMSKIDRIQGSNDIMGKFKVMTDWTYTDSDHCAVIIKIETPEFKKRNNIVRIDTRFMSNVILKEKFLRELGLRMAQLTETNMDPHQSLEFLKMNIRSIAIEIATNYKKEMEREFMEVKNEISFWQTSFECAKSEVIREMAQSNLDKATDRRDKYLNDRGTYLCERSKSKWYQEGEKGSKYFLNIVKSKSNKNEMVELKTENGMTTDGEQIKGMVQSFYKKLYERGDTSPTAYDDFLINMDQISADNKYKILTPLNMQELLATLGSCSDSAPGPDGIPYSLIRFTWPIYGPILMNSWVHSISSGVLPPSHRSSYLRLIPKEGKDLTQLKNWRPITLSNCDIKIITKTISRRMTANLTSIIGHNQTAYMKGRQITDNLHIMQHAIAKANELDDDSMIVSLDAEKAFDSISHSYIKKILEHIGLGEFSSTFDLLYNNQQVDIILNNEISGS